MTLCNTWLAADAQHEYTSCEYCTSCLICIPGHDCTLPSLGRALLFDCPASCGCS
jgi:hypothetical protein